MSDETKIEMVEFEIPGCPEFEKNEVFTKVYAFAVCFTQWLDQESAKRLASTSKQVIAHRLLTALEPGPVVQWRKSDWKLVCELIEDSEMEFVPTLTGQTKKEDGTVETQTIPPPPFLTRRYLGAILKAKSAVEADDGPTPQQVRDYLGGGQSAVADNAAAVS
jgi:hypothetical protein